MSCIRKELSIYSVNDITNGQNKTNWLFLIIVKKVKQSTKARLCTMQAENIGMISGKFLPSSLAHST
jgi:hypothetical protein